MRDLRTYFCLRIVFSRNFSVYLPRKDRVKVFTFYIHKENYLSSEAGSNNSFVCIYFPSLSDRRPFLRSLLFWVVFALAARINLIQMKFSPKKLRQLF